MELLDTHISPGGNYMVHQYDGFWVEFYRTTNKTWKLQEDSFEEAKQPGTFKGYPQDYDR